MKRIHFILAAILAVAFSAILPMGYLLLQERQFAAPVSYRVEEANLQYGELFSADTAVFGLDNSSDAIAWRLNNFGSGAATVVPLRSSHTEARTEQLTEFLASVCEVPVEIIAIEADYRLALFGDGTAVPFWWIYAEFNEHWVSTMAIDDVSGMILCFELHSGISELPELFPDSFEQGAVEPGTEFETLAARRVTAALSDRMDAGVEALPGIEPGTVKVTFGDDPDLWLALPFVLGTVEGISFNPPMHTYLW
ncbi:MAG: hypothetical protein E7464_05075 [Ruminococcaceae bacterium]|nr:hypothetical protein [Oscillospiraceae bacterium]